MSYYQTLISELAPAGYDPRHIEACMRLEHPTLDGLDRAQFAQEVEISVEYIKMAGTDEAESLARTFSL